MFKSLKSKFLIAILGIVIISNFVIGTIILSIARNALTKSVNSDLTNIARSIAIQFEEINNREFRMLTTISTMNYVRDTSIPIKERIDFVTANATNIDKNYISVSMFDVYGNTYNEKGVHSDMSNTKAYTSAMIGKKSLTDPQFVDGEFVLVYSVPIFDKDLQPAGAVYAIVKAERMYTVCRSLKVGNSGHPKIINMQSGVTVGDEKMEKITLGENIGKNATGNFKTIIDNLKKGKASTAVYSDPVTNKKMACAYQKVGSSCNWAVLCSAPYSEFYGSLNAMIVAIVIVMIFMIAVSVCVSIFIVSKSLDPLKNLKNSITEIASGSADLTKRISVKNADEIGEVVKGFNQFSEKLQNIISGVKESKNLLETAGEDLVASTSDTLASITEILDEIKLVYSEIDVQTKGVDETSESISDITQKISQLDHLIEVQASDITESSAAIEQMMGNISSINSSMDKMAEEFALLLSSSDEGNKLQKEVNEKILFIEEQSKTLQTANQAIASIASQTNLLAMNAAIEAAHAGEAGKGFSVVADEIRKLSETSSVQSKQIGTQLKGIRNSIESVVTASVQSSAAFNNVSNKIIETDNLVRQIKDALEEQNQGFQQITEALGDMNDTTGEVRGASGEMQKSSESIVNQMQKLKSVSDEIGGKMNQMQTGARKIKETGAALSDISEKMEDSISEIGIQIDQFIVEEGAANSNVPNVANNSEAQESAAPTAANSQDFFVKK